MVSRIALALVVLGSASCDRSTAAPLPKKDPIVTTTTPSSAYRPAVDGFVMHEWGTITSVVGSDGTALLGLHHEEEDLPPFVGTGRLTRPHGNGKMETPVTYFYSPTPRTVEVKVGFAHGAFTQFYPLAIVTEPNAYGMEDALLDWGKVEILGRDVAPKYPEPIGNTTWGFARKTAANAIRVTPTSGEPQEERFLFYRGVGNVALPLKISFDGPWSPSGGKRPVLTNEDKSAALRGTFLLTVDDKNAGFTELADLGAGETRTVDVPAAAMSHANFVESLKTRLTARLIEDGLYADEAKSMVDTWERSYFLTPGVRVLHLLPAARIDAVIPLTITPKPDVVKRTMVIRIELMTPEHEAKLVGWLDRMAKPATRAAARADFLSLGRFTEPHLTRALSLAKDEAAKSAGLALLIEVRMRHRWAPAFAAE